VIKTYENVPAYQYLLLEKVSLSSKTYLTSNFNYSVTKKRLVMMTKSSNRTITLLKQLLILPLLAVSVFVFSAKLVAANSLLPFSSNTIETPQQGKKQDTSIDRVVYLSKWDKAMPYTKDGIAPQLMDEYNSIVHKYVYTDEKGLERFKNGAMTDAEKSRLLTIFKQMSRQQQSDSKIGFSKRMEPWKKTVPTDAQFEKWKDETKYGVWIDGKKVNNKDLDKYKASDFSHFFTSNLHYTEKMKKDVMKSFNLKVMYAVQLDLMTHSGYTDYYNKSMAAPEDEMYFRVLRGPDGKAINWRWGVQ
jgi:bla regulator protein BlaR1